MSIDLDNSTFFPPDLRKVDCFVHFETTGSCLIECKTTYIKRAISQFEICLKYLREHWNDFLSAEDLPNDTPFPHKFILYLERGLSREKYSYELERNTRRLKVRGNGYHKVLGHAFIEVYTRRDIENMTKNLDRFGSVG
ncbi:hypothetical protein ApAK_01940 [Thermoplasmatales archaeon AK]|nr:hypothetical protein [Thermoplasmatales archaeon AK]